MYLSSFSEFFPEVAEKECHRFKLRNHHKLPDDDYALLEFFCADPGCDCRRVMLNVVARSGPRSFMASISFAFDPDDEMAGPFLDPLNSQSRHAAELLALVKETLQDPAYVATLEEHYRMVKGKVSRGPGGCPGAGRVGRNAPCPCGSGRKFKKCCGKGAPATEGPELEELLRRRLEEYKHPKYADRPPGEYVERLHREFPSAGALLARFMAYEPEGPLQRSVQTLLFVGCQDPGVDPAARDAITRSAAPVLRSAMKDPAIADDRKYHIGPLLEACGVKLARKDYQESFHNFDETANRKNAEFIREISADPQTLEQALEQVGLVSGGEPVRPSKRKIGDGFVFAAMTAQHNPDAGAMLLATVAAIAAEHGKAPREAEMALLLARRGGGARAAWALGELSQWPGLGPLGEKARVLAGELGAEGIQPHAPYGGTFSHAWATQTDGAGSRNLVVFFRTPAGVMDALVFMPNDEVGIKDLWCAFGRGAEFEKDYLKRENEIKTAPASLELARELLGDALATHEARGTPPPGRMLLYRPMLGAAPISIRHRQPNLGAYALELLARNPELAADSEALAQETSFRQLWCATDEAYQFVRQNLRGRKHAAGASWIGAALIERFAREVAPQDRERLLRRMAINLETEAWAGRAADPLNRLAARTWIVLSEELAPFHEVPFVRALARRALEAISVNIARGFRSQREANDLTRA
jgi:hypothetical protein